MEAAVALNLSFQTIEQSALEFGDLAASQTGHMDVIALRATLVVVLFSLHVHEIEFVHQAVSLEQTERAIDRYAVDMRIKFAGVTQNLARIKMLFGGLDHAQDGAALMRHAQAA
jgi:hypothetical protein